MLLYIKSKSNTTSFFTTLLKFCHMTSWNHGFTQSLCDKIVKISVVLDLLYCKPIKINDDRKQL